MERRLKVEHIDEKQVPYWTTHASATRWYRDVGPTFARNGKGQLKAIDFNFNCYGHCQPGSAEAQQKEGIDREIAGLAGAPTIRTELVSEGGNHDFNGKGTMIACEAVELQRNPHLTKEQIEQELLRLLGQKKNDLAKARYR
ncbi:MAG TPA: agmatine deiminase family protein [Chthoniobacterales bacterium]